MTTFTGIPVWVQKSKTAVKQSSEWQTFTRSLFDVVHNQMIESGVATFSELSNDERRVMMRRALQETKSNEEYTNLLDRMSESLDVFLSKEVDGKSARKEQSKTRNEMLEHECEEAVSRLISAQPELHSSFHYCFNASLPPLVRFMLWRNALIDRTAQTEYLKLVKENSQNLVSPQDFEISQKCHAILDSDPTLKDITNRKVFFSLMRHVLSYRHAQNTKVPLMDGEYRLLVPLVECSLKVKRGKPMTTMDLSILVHEYTHLMNNRQDYMRYVSTSLANLVTEVHSIITECDQELSICLEHLKMSSDSREEYIKYVPKKNVGVAKLLHPVIRSLFIGYLPLDTVMHVWDMRMIGMTEPKYDPLPYICACILLLLREDLLGCTLEQEASSVLLAGCRKMKTEHFQTSFTERGFQDYIMHQLTKEKDLSNFPVFHPLPASNLPPWRNWYSDKLVTYLQRAHEPAPVNIIPSDLSSVVSSKRRPSFPNEEMMQLQQDRDKLQDEAGQLREERDVLIQELEEEHKMMMGFQRDAEDEIEHLRRQINALHEAKRQDLSVMSLNSPIYASSSKISQAPTPINRQPQPPSTQASVPTPPARPPSNKSQASTHKSETEPKKPVSVADEPTPVPSTNDLAEEKASKATIDLVSNIMTGINALVHGQGKSQQVLENQTKKDHEIFEAAYVKAKKMVFGKNLTDADINELPPEERKIKGEKMEKELQRILFSAWK